jgi:glycosyltransferase involved in cell wall biosynthesis
MQSLGRHLKVSVAMSAYNEEKYVAGCLNALLHQTFTDFEIVIVNDNSTDNTAGIIGSFHDERIRCYKNEFRLGFAKSQNKSLGHCGGDYVFLTDADCTVAKDWIEEGLKVLEGSALAGVEGRIFLVSEDYQPTYSDYVIGSFGPGQYSGPSVAYRRSVVQSVGGFDEKYTYFNDRNLGLKVLRSGGKISFNERMVAYHPPLRPSIKEFVQTANRVTNKVCLFKDFGDRRNMVWRIVYPKNLIAILFPPAVLLVVFLHKFRKWDDFKLIPFIYPKLVYERFCLWRQCIRERVFLV